MVEPNLPENQIRSLPLRTVANAADGDVLLVGQTVSRYWSPDVLGLNTPTNFTNLGAGGSALTTNVLNVTGCTKFAFNFKRTVLAAGGDVGTDTYQLFVLYTHSNGVAEDINIQRGNRQGIQQVLGVSGPVYGAGPFPKTSVFSILWSSNVIQGTGGGGGLATVGRSLRIGIFKATVANANQDYTCEMWGTQ